MAGLRNWLFLLATAACWWAPSVPAQFIFDAYVPLQPEVEEAIDRAQGWLAASQQRNGSWGSCNGRNAMATMALMVNGTTPGHGKYGTEVSRAIDFLISSQHDTGLLVVGTSGNMYQHALATLCLAEAYGMTHNPGVRGALIKAADLIVQAQNRAGGWRYTPTSQDTDLSVTVMQVMALRATADTGVYVPEEAVKLAIKCVKSLHNAQVGSFGYSGVDGGNFNRAAAGMVCLQSCGLFNDPAIPRAVEYLKNQNYENTGGFYWYGHYYASVALYHYGGVYWKTYYPQICKKVLTDWKGPGHYGDVLDTAWATLVIGVPYRYLPIYQR